MCIAYFIQNSFFLHHPLHVFWAIVLLTIILLHFWVDVLKCEFQMKIFVSIACTFSVKSHWNWFQWARVNILFRQWLGTIRVPFYQHGLHLLPVWTSNYMSNEVWVKLLVHSKTSTVPLLTFCICRWLHHTMWMYGNGPLMESRKWQRNG